MKTSLTRSKNSLILFLSVLALPLWAQENKPIAQVTDIQGQVFVVTPDGKTKTLKAKDHLEEKSEIMVEEGASVTLNDYYNATYHLIGGSHLKFFNKSVQLKRGKTWVQSQNMRHPLVLTTANGHVDFLNCEFITTFDQTTSRSQVLVVNGDVDVSNILDRNMKYNVPAGSFTLVDPEVEDGTPRSPTKVGLSSLNAALAEFKRLPEKMKDAALPARAIASVEDMEIAPAPAPQKKGEIIFMSSNRMPASVNGSAHQYYKKAVTTKKAPELSDAPIKIYGVSATPREPASVAPVKPVPRKPADKVQLDPEFGDSLKKQTLEQPKYSKELEGLIEDLKSY